MPDKKVDKNVCTKCKREFTTAYSLKRHTDKDIPCVPNKKEYRCTRCKKNFSSNQSMKVHMNNKKVPCIKVSNSISSIVSIEHKIKLSNIATENKIKLLEKKKEADLENNMKILEKQAEKQQQKLALEKEVEMAKIKTLEKQTEKLLIEKELLKYKQDLKLELIMKQRESTTEKELVKTKRKEITPQVINNNQYITNNNMYIESFSNFINDKVIPATEADVIKSIIKPMMAQMYDDRAYNIYQKANTADDIPKYILTRMYNNATYPQGKNMFYGKKTDQFYAILRSIVSDEKEVMQVDFEKYIFPLLKLTLDPVYEHIKNVVQEPRPSDDSYIKYSIFTNISKNTQDYLKSLAKLILSEENTINNS